MKETKRKGWVDHFSWGLSRLAMFLPAIIALVTIYDVFFRYIVGRSTIWGNELSLWMGGWVYLLAGLYAMQQRSHIRITVLYDYVPDGVKKLFNTLGTIFILAWTAALIWGGFAEAWDALINWERMPSIWKAPIPATTQPLILIVMILITVQAFSNLITDWNDTKSDHDDLDAEIEEIKRAQGIIEEKGE